MLRHVLSARPSSIFPLTRALAGALAAVTLAACADRVPTEPAAPTAAASPSLEVTQSAPAGTTIAYDSKDLDEYGAKWSNIYGPGELAVGGTRRISKNGAFTVSAVPFRTGADFSVFDHLKYIAISNQAFDVPAVGSLTFSVDIEAVTPGATDTRVVRGCYGPPGSYQNVGDPCARPWSGSAYQGQQAGVVLNMVNFATGQLFDWFISDNQAMALVERLPSNVTANAAFGEPGYVGLDKAYTQLVRVQRIAPGRTHSVATRYTRGFGVSRVEFFLNGDLFATVDDVGVPLDVQGVRYTGTYPSYGPGEVLNDELDSFVIGHGLFSLLDAFPFQHPERPDLSVSVPMSERLFGQGATGTFKNFRVTTN